MLLLAARAMLVVGEGAHPWTPLHCAASKGHERVVAQLLAASSDLAHVTDSEGWTALHRAVSNNRTQVALLLLAVPGTATAVVPLTGWTALHYAVRWGNEELTETLLAVRPELLQAVDRSGLSVLHVAVQHGLCRSSCLQRLWRLHKAALHINVRHVGTPFHCAIRKNDPGAIEELQSGLSLEEIARAFATCSKPCPSLRPLAERWLLIWINKDVVDLVWVYLGV